MLLDLLAGLALGVCRNLVIGRGAVHIHTLSYVSETTTTRIQSGEAPFLTGEDSGELKHALLHAGGPTQSQLSRPMS